MVSQINHFNSYNKIDKVVGKSGINIEEISVKKDCINFKSKMGNLNSNRLPINQDGIGIPNTM